MNVLVITRKLTAQIVAVVECPQYQNPGTVALVWAHSHGMERFPTDLAYSDVFELTTFSSALQYLVPCAVWEEFSKKGREMHHEKSKKRD